LNGLEATRQILKALPRTEVLILTLHESEQLVRRVIESGARAYVLKSDAGRNLVEGVAALSQHKSFFSSNVATVLVESYLKGGKTTGKTNLLTPREREVVQLLAEGKSNKEIGVALGVSVHTVETHRSNIMRKLGANSLSNLIRYALRNKIVQF
jgi:DNA-binding NarL/FixJ family response regulator